MIFRSLHAALVIGAILGCGPFLAQDHGRAHADDLFVNGLTGKDFFDGKRPVGNGGLSGPVKTISGALVLAQHGDEIHVADCGIPYFESLSLYGSRHSGFETRRFVIDGGGATLSGFRVVPPGTWRAVGDGLWSLGLTRKGYFSIRKNGERLPAASIVRASLATIADELSEGGWRASHGTIFYRQVGETPPQADQFEFAALATGISLVGVQNVTIRNLKIEGFRFDGIHAQGYGQGIELDDVTISGCGRSGLAVTGATQVDATNCDFRGNGEASLTVETLAKVQVNETWLSE